MRIISKFRDFYDGVMRTGMDREVVYVRENVKIDPGENFGLNFDTKETGNLHETKLVCLGYCGQIIKIMDVTYQVKSSRPGFLYDSYRRVFFDFDEFKEFMLSNKLSRDWDFTARWYPGKFEKFRKFDTAKMGEIFHRYQTPLFLIYHKTKYGSSKGITTITLGPKLQDYEFHKIKDPYTTYQDIFQYVAGVLNRPDAKMVKISDKDKVHKHGFDKWSFRQKGPKK